MSSIYNRNTGGFWKLALIIAAVVILSGFFFRSGCGDWIENKFNQARDFASEQLATGNKPAEGDQPVNATAHTIYRFGNGEDGVLKVLWDVMEIMNKDIEKLQKGVELQQEEAERLQEVRTLLGSVRADLSARPGEIDPVVTGGHLQGAINKLRATNNMASASNLQSFADALMERLRSDGENFNPINYKPTAQ